MAFLRYFCILLATLSQHFSSAFNIWPLPQKAEEAKQFFSIDPEHFHFQVDAGGECDILHKAARRYLDRMFLQNCSRINRNYRRIPLINTTVDFDNITDHLGVLLQITIKVEGQQQPCETIPSIHMDESYRIEITKAKTGSMIHAKSVWGALRGLDTLSQMMEMVGRNQYTLRLGQVSDWPRFAYRGFMIDTARHYLPMHVILEHLDAMEMNKMNVLHWHIVDDESFPFVSETFPELSDRGAYMPDYVYTVEEVKTVIQYGNERGIQVLPEFDTPGHTRSWGKSHPNLLTRCYDRENNPTGNLGPLDPTKNFTYEFVAGLFREIVERFPSQYLHLGGDEVDFDCWKSNPEVHQFMMEHFNRDDGAKMESYYIQKLVHIVENLKRSYIVWQEVFDDEVVLKPETLVHVWKDDHWRSWQEEMKLVTGKGYHALLSSCWYLNRIEYAQDWYKLYQCDPQSFNGTTREQSLVLGGEACMWAEFVDGSNLISRSWPRAIAVAERLWSDKQATKFYKQAIARFRNQRCRMQLWGIRAEPADGTDYCYCDDAL